MQALRRDVLRWLITLNLSFPIKNIRRDFSNGFLVAEILSRYYPQEIQMHSFDYGTKLAKKMDNWEQLKRIFGKIDFPIFQDEIDNIINCGPNDGIRPLLERLYGFLTHKRYKREDPSLDNNWVQNSEPNDLFTNAMSSLTKNEYQHLMNGEVDACFEPPTSNHSRESDGNADCEEAFCNSEEQVGTVKCISGEANADALGGLSPEEMVIRRGDDVVDKIGDSLSKAVISDNENSIEQMSGLSKARNLSNAVERARQKERERGSSPVKIGPNLGNGVSGELIVGSQVSRDSSLAFRSPNRQRQFKMYTLSDYKKQQPGDYVMLGKLGPDTTKELIVKRERLERMKEFGRSARNINVSQAPEPRKPKTKPVSNREKALEFASRIPKPKRKENRKEEQEENIPICNQPLSELEQLEAKHQLDRQQVEAMRRDIESFLR